MWDSNKEEGAESFWFFWFFLIFSGFFLEREGAHLWLLLESSLFPAPVEKTLQLRLSLDHNYKNLHLLILTKDCFLN